MSKFNFIPEKKSNGFKCVIITRYNEKVDWISYIIDNVDQVIIYNKGPNDDLFKDYTHPLIVSVFAGAIGDTGIDSAPIVSYAVAKFKGLSNVKILWAGCREVYTIQRAIDLGCHIITMPDTVIDKLPGLGMNLFEASVHRVKAFRKDALSSGLSIN